MESDQAAADVLLAYPIRVESDKIEPLRSAGGFSGAQFWKVRAGQHAYCLRRWPREYPSIDGLQSIHAVLQHAAAHGLEFVPVPLASKTGRTYVQHAEYLWELSPWMEGTADYRLNPRREKLAAAMQAIAYFHQATKSAPVGAPLQGTSLGISRRLEQLRAWRATEAMRLAACMSAGDWPELLPRGRRLLEYFAIGAEAVEQLLASVAPLRVTLQPCLRDVWHDHVLFRGARVTGLIDFGALAQETVAGDVARLLGSLVGEDPAGWQEGLAAYETVRPLDANERRLVPALDRSGVLLSGMNWLEWIYRQGRVFADRGAVVARIDEILARLEKQVAQRGGSLAFPVLGQ